MSTYLVGNKYCFHIINIIFLIIIYAFMQYVFKVAFMVSEFVNSPSDPSLSPTVQFGIWSRPSFVSQTQYNYIIDKIECDS